jgi:hypothetical protein
VHFTTAELALAGSLGGVALGGVIGVWGSWVVAGRAAEGQRQAALAPLHWSKRAEAYVEILQVLNQWSGERQRMVRSYRLAGETDDKPTPEHDWTALDALVGTFGSNLMRDRYKPGY